MIAFHSDLAAEIVDLVLIPCWVGMVAILIIGKRRAAPGAQRSDRKSVIGMSLQFAGYAICFAAPRPIFFPPFAISSATEKGVAVFTVGLALLSTWFCYAAACALGRHWALMARVIDGHELVRSGPYGIVRNPIYLGMLGLAIATGVAFSHWQAVIPALMVFLIGTLIRIRSEEKLLRGAFGTLFDDYAKQVPALLPRVL